MAEYHVGCGMFGNIYAGTTSAPRKGGLKMWRNKSDVTSEAIEAVMGILLWKWSVTIRTRFKKYGWFVEAKS